MVRSLVLRAVSVLVCGSLSAAGVVLASAPAAAVLQQKTPPLSTPWTSQVSTTSPLPEYPRPQLTRRDWLSLNGQWEWQAASSLAGAPPAGALDSTILVPYPVESALSGIQRTDARRMWYRRSFTVPAGWAGQRVILNFGAVTWESTVRVNGTEVATHRGGYDPFSVDITPALRSGSNELVVGVYSPLTSENPPLGKQTLEPSGFFYTGASGIWQSVWLEPTPAARVTRLQPTPDVPAGEVAVAVQTAGADAGTTVRVEVVAGGTATGGAVSGGTVVGSATGSAGTSVRVPVPNARLWSPDDPYLYNLRVTLRDAQGQELETVGGYFGMRSISTAIVGGVRRPLLNGKVMFNLGMLDQGYWPDGIYTAPTDEALRWDIEQQKSFGFNTIRKHVKVEPARWYYHADRLGMLVWQDMPSMRAYVEPSTAQKQQWEREITSIIENLRGITSIFQWTAFNEGWGQFDGARITDYIKGLDPTRLVDNLSGPQAGGYDSGNGDVIDDHRYNADESRLPTETRIAQLGEFGGLTLGAPRENQWLPDRPRSGYDFLRDGGELTYRWAELLTTLKRAILTRGLSAAIYTQFIDVEVESNGLYTYDRRLLKVDRGVIRAVTSALLEAAGVRPRERLVSVQVAAAGSATSYLSHDAAGEVVVSPVWEAVPADVKRAATWWQRDGLSDPDCVSLESRTMPGRFLRRDGSGVRVSGDDGTPEFRADATFCERAGKARDGVSWESAGAPGRFLRAFASNVGVLLGSVTVEGPGAPSWAQYVTWRVAPPWWRSERDLPVGSVVSLEAVTAGSSGRYLRHAGGLGYLSEISDGSDAVAKADASWTVRAGLADPTCYSLESVNYPGQYLRHGSFRLRKEPNDASPLFAQDATFCTTQARAGASTDVLGLASYNLAGHLVRHFAGEGWLALRNGPKPTDGRPDLYDADTSWRVVPGWSVAGRGSLSGPAGVDLGQVRVGQSVTRAVTISNRGRAAASVTSASTPGGAWSVTVPAGTVIPPGGSAQVSIRFVPTTAGRSRSTVTVNGDRLVPLEIALTGTAVLSGALSAPSSVQLDDVRVGRLGLRGVLVTNTGTGPATVTARSVTGPEWSVTGLLEGTVIPAGGSAPVGAWFAPTTIGTSTSILTITYDDGAPGLPDPPAPVRVSLTGNAIGTGALSAPATLDLGNTQIAATTTRTLTVTNTGQGPATLASASATGAGWSVTGPPAGTVIPPGGSEQVTVTFTPTAAGPATGTLTLTDQDGTATRTILTSRVWRQLRCPANLPGTSQVAANLSDTLFCDANLAGANAAAANLARSSLVSATLAGANLAGADLTDTILTGANLTGADLTGADLTGADLTGADLTDATLTRATLTRACYTSTTRWPTDYTPPPPTCP